MSDNQASFDHRETPEPPHVTLAPAPKADVGKVTPMIAQFLEIKAANPDCLLFYRMGDFYELFFEDAELASRALGIVLTKRGKHGGEDIPMCGVPVERADDYLQRLIALKFRVAVCEQIEDPAEAKKRGPKSVVKRDVVRLVTPGTITEERLLDPARANILLALARQKIGDNDYAYGLAALDISTGAFSVSDVALGQLQSEIARLDPSEIIAAESLCQDRLLAPLLSEMRCPVMPLGRDLGDFSSAERRIKDYFGVATLEGFGTFSRAEVAAAAAAIFYVERTQFGARPVLSLPARALRGSRMEIDAATRANLEITKTLGGERTGSLIDAIDHTVTPAGGRLLTERLAGPLTDMRIISRRHDAVAFFVEKEDARVQLRKALKSVPDLARALSRVALGRSGPRDLAALAQGLFAAQHIAQNLRGDNLPIEIAESVKDLTRIDLALANNLGKALRDELPLNRRDGGFVREGFSPDLDETNALRNESRGFIAGLTAKYAELSEIKQIKIKHNNFLGFFIEVSQVHGERLLKAPFNETFVHRQTMADAMRFSTGELADLATKIATAGDRALGIELSIFDDLAAQILAQEEPIKACAAALGVLDVAASLAASAVQNDWVRPVVDESLTLILEGGRHPVVEAALKGQGAPFVANHCDLTDPKGMAGRVAIVTGPNMAGKSTYLRQNALIVLLAQMGSFVPALHAHIGIVDRLFSRVGASDDLARGRSTFMVEMVETAAILNQATSRSLVILDEIGRGTATFDGLSIAWAVMEHLHDVNRSRALFATHFHELTQLTKKLDRLVNLTMRVTDWNGEVIFLHEIIPGAADRSYGIQVAKLAGLPPYVVERAKQLLTELESSDRRAPVERLVADLPLFSSLPPPKPVAAPPQKSEAQKALESLHPDELSPREALDALYRLKDLLK